MTGRIRLDAREDSLLAGAEGPAMHLAMRTLLRAADIMGAKQLVPIGFAHLDACFYTGQSHVDFAQYLLTHGARFRVPAEGPRGPDRHHARLTRSWKENQWEFWTERRR